MIGALGATIAAFALQGQVPSFVILLLSILRRGAVRGVLGVHPRLPQGADRAPTRSSRRSCSTTSRPRSSSSPCARRRCGRPGSTAPVSKPMSDFVDIPLIINLPGDPPRLRVRDRAADGGRRCRSSCSGRPRATSCGRPGSTSPPRATPGMSAGGSMMLAMALSGALAGLAGAFLVIGTVGQLSLDLSGGIGFTAIALALLAGLRPSGVVARRAAVRRADVGRQADGDPVRDPVRPARVHHGAGHHVRGRAEPDPVDLADQDRRSGQGGRRPRTCRRRRYDRRDRRRRDHRRGPRRPARDRGTRGSGPSASSRSALLRVLPREPEPSTRPASSPSGSTSRAARAPSLQTSVGVLWIVAGLVVLVRRDPPAAARRAVPLAAVAPAARLAVGRGRPRRSSSTASPRT